MREQICAVAAQDEHQQQLGVQAGGRNVVGGEAGDSLGQGVFQVHTAISPQRDGQFSVLSCELGSPDPLLTNGRAAFTGIRNVLAQLRIQAKDFRVKDGREGDPGRIGQEYVRGSAVDFVGGGYVGDDAAFQREDVSQR